MSMIQSFNPVLRGSVLAKDRLQWVDILLKDIQSRRNIIPFKQADIGVILDCRRVDMRKVSLTASIYQEEAHLRFDGHKCNLRCGIAGGTEANSSTCYM